MNRAQNSLLRCHDVLKERNFHADKLGTSFRFLAGGGGGYHPGPILGLYRTVCQQSIHLLFFSQSLPHFNDRSLLPHSFPSDSLRKSVLPRGCRNGAWKWEYEHVMMFAQVAQVPIQLLDSLFVRFDALALEAFIEL